MVVPRLDSPSIPRRLLLRDLGRGGLAIAVLGPAACGTDAAGGDATPSPTDGTPNVASPTAPQPRGTVTATDWRRVDRGFVSAHLILTHLHDDHAGSLSEVMTRAAAATRYAGEPDLARIRTPRELQAVGDGETVAGLRIVATPGHKAGHISVFDPSGAGVLLAGDALNGNGGAVAGPNPDLTPDMPEAWRSVARLATLTFETAYFGHGDEVLTGAAGEVAALAAANPA